MHVKRRWILVSILCSGQRWHRDKGNIEGQMAIKYFL